MSQPSDTDVPAEPHEGIDAFANPDARDREANQSQGSSRGGNEGPPPTDAPKAGEAPEISGTAAGDPLAGLHIDDQDLAEAVPGDEGPEHPGERRD